MKIRNGFVSNSSSSSFVVAFPSIPKSVQELKEMLFGDEKTYSAGEWGEGKWSTEEVAETVWQDFQGQKPLTKEEAIEEIEGSWYLGCPNLSDYYKDGEYDWEAHKQASQEDAQKVYDRFAEQDIDLFKFEYSDNEGEYGCALEHGELFYKLKHLQLSHH